MLIRGFSVAVHNLVGVYLKLFKKLMTRLRMDKQRI